MEQIRLHCTEDQWFASFLVDGRPNQEIKTLFNGDYCLPTPYRSSASYETVKRSIELQNPGVEVN